MTTHDQAQLAAYCFNALTTDEAVAVDQHLRTCPECQLELEELRELHEVMSSVPPEALLDGEAEDSELLFARIMRAATEDTDDDTPAPRRRPRGGIGWWRRPLLVAAAIVLLAAAFGGGLLTARHTSPAAAPATTFTVSATSHQTGVGMSMDITPAHGWVALTGHFTGVTPGTPCDIYVVGHDGRRILAGGWVAPADADKAVVTVNGSAVIDPKDIAAVEVDTDTGRQMVVAPVR
jgi:hypothetical protein